MITKNTGCSFKLFQRSFILMLMVVSPALVAESATPEHGMVVGPNFISWLAEATESDLGNWVIRREGDPYFQNNEPDTVDPILGTHLEFMGNNPTSGPPDSPLEYTFVAPTTGTYRLGARMYQRLGDLPRDRANDIFIKMEGKFTSGNAVSTENLKILRKMYGSGVHRWGSLFNIEASMHSPVEYNLIEGETYTFTVAGRSQLTNIDYWILYDISSVPIVIQGSHDIATEYPEYIPGPVRHTTIDAFSLRHTNVDGFSKAMVARKMDTFVLKNSEADSWAAAQFVYKGTDGEATFAIHTLQEGTEQSHYRLRVNGRLIGEVRNDRIDASETSRFSKQSHPVNSEAVPLNHGDIIQIEFKGSWEGVRLTTTGFPAR